MNRGGVKGTPHLVHAYLLRYVYWWYGRWVPQAIRRHLQPGAVAGSSEGTTHRGRNQGRHGKPRGTPVKRVENKVHQRGHENVHEVKG